MQTPVDSSATQYIEVTTYYFFHILSIILVIDKHRSSSSMYRLTAHPYPSFRLQQKRHNISLLFCLFILVLYHHSWNCLGLGKGNTRLRLTQYDRKKYLSGLLCRKCQRLEYWNTDHCTAPFNSKRKPKDLNTIHLVKCKTTSKIKKNIAYLRNMKKKSNDQFALSTPFLKVFSGNETNATMRSHVISFLREGSWCSAHYSRRDGTRLKSQCLSSPL